MDEQTMRMDIEATLRTVAHCFKRRICSIGTNGFMSGYWEIERTISGLRILEVVGSGTSPLKHFYPSVLTSDIMPLDYLDYVFDAHDIDCVSVIENESLDVIALTQCFASPARSDSFPVLRRKKVTNWRQNNNG